MRARRGGNPTNAAGKKKGGGANGNAGKPKKGPMKGRRKGQGPGANNQSNRIKDTDGIRDDDIYEADQPAAEGANRPGRYDVSFLAASFANKHTILSRESALLRRAGWLRWAPQ